jgi:hypothetical protein
MRRTPSLLLLALEFESESAHSAGGGAAAKEDELGGAGDFG